MEKKKHAISALSRTKRKTSFWPSKYAIKYLTLFPESIATFGSKIFEILGSKRPLDELNKRVREAQYYGITRLEVSIFIGALSKFK